MKKFEKIFFSMIAMIMMVAVESVFISCTNDDDDFRVPAQETQLDQAFNQDSVALMTRGITSTNMFNNVIDYNDIDESILSHFQYWCQNTGFPSPTNYCVPTSFMMAVSCLLNNYNASNKFNPSKNKLLQFASISPYDNVAATSYVENNYSNIDIDTHHYNDDSQGRTNAKNAMEWYLNNNYFVAVALKAYVGNSGQSFYSYYSPDNPDLITNSNYSLSNYIQSSGYTNHTVLVLRIDKFSTGNGIVTYIDPYRAKSSGSNRRYCLYSRFMDSMKFTASSNNSAGYFFTHIGYNGN